MKITKKEFDTFWAACLSDNWYIEEGCEYEGDEEDSEFLFVEDYACVASMALNNHTPFQDQVKRRANAGESLSPYNLRDLITVWREGRTDQYLAIRFDAAKADEVRKALETLGVEVFD